MQSKGNAPNTQQKRWRETIRDLGCIACGWPSHIEIHHPVGATAKHNKQPIGHWWILPLCKSCHEAVTEDRDALSYIAFRFRLVGPFDSEKLLFMKLLERVTEIPFPSETEAAILDYHR